MLNDIVESEDLWQTLVEDEGYETEPYRDSRGIWTFGVGRNLETVGLSREEVIRGLRTGFKTKAFVQYLFKNDCERCARFLSGHYPWMVGRSWSIRKAMLCMCFQLGEKNFADFAPTLALIRDGNMRAAEIRLRNTKWFQQTPHRVERVISLLQSKSLSTPSIT
jgi:lysozyme